MYRRIAYIAVLLTAGFASTAGRDRTRAEIALERAAFDWDKGAYVAALTAYQDLLSGPDAAASLDAIALQTGELYRTTELTTDGAHPKFSPDSRHFAFETGPGVSAGAASGAGRTTHVRSVAAPARDVTTLDGGDASFCPGGRHVAFLHVPASAELTAAQNAVATAATNQERAPRQQTLARLIARTGRIVLRDIESGRDQAIDTGDLLKTGVTCAADGAVLFAGAAEADSETTQIYAARAAGAPQAMTQGPGFKVPAATDAAGRTLVFLIPRQGPFRVAAAGGRGGGGATAATSFGVLTLGGKATTLNGVSPALSRDGRFLTWIARAGAATAAGEQRLLVAAIDTLAAPVELRKGTVRLDAPAISADGSRIAFQAMPRDDWEIHLVGRDGKDATRLTREIQHDLAPQFLGGDRLIGLIGEARHRRSYLYEGLNRTRLFHNNTVRTIAPEYVWVASGDGSTLLIVSERDGDTVSLERGVYLVDMSAKVSIADVKARVAASLTAERALRANGRRLFAPIAAQVATVAAAASPARVYAHEKALFDFDSKHITRPGNKLAGEYLYNAYASFGYQPEYQWFAPRNAFGGQTANVLATLKGTVNPELVYVVSSHYDSVAAGPGADDDTSGTAALLETARIMAGHPMPATIVFASFTGEEGGLLGSREYVRQAVAKGVQLAGALNNDMFGWSNDHRLDNTIRYSNAGIRDVQHAGALLFSGLVTYDAKYYKNTDAHAYYEAYGDVVGGIGSYPVLGNPHYHQSHDILETINHEQVLETTKATLASLMLLAASPERLRDVTVAASGGATEVRWSPAREKDVRGYRVRYTTAAGAERTIDVAEPRARLTDAKAGAPIMVQAVNRAGLGGWDWAVARP